MPSWEFAQYHIAKYCIIYYFSNVTNFYCSFNELFLFHYLRKPSLWCFNPFASGLNAKRTPGCKCWHDSFIIITIVLSRRGGGVAENACHPTEKRTIVQYSRLCRLVCNLEDVILVPGHNDIVRRQRISSKNNTMTYACTRPMAFLMSWRMLFRARVYCFCVFCFWSIRETGFGWKFVTFIGNVLEYRRMPLAWAFAKWH